MGKTKTRRQKYHTSAVRLKQKEPKEEGAADVDMKLETLSEVSEEMPRANLFEGVDIDLSRATKELPDFDARSAVTSKTFRGMNMSKKEKRQIKHNTWMERVEAIQTAKKEAKARARRRDTAVVGDLRPLEDTLPTLELLLRDTGHQRDAHRNEAKPKPIKKTKQRQKEMMQDINIFQQVLQHPAFQKDPTGTISEHLKNKLQQENTAT